MRTLPTFCGKDCGANACPLLVELEDGHAIGIRHNPAAGPHLRGCRRGFRLHEERESPERLTRPLIRTGERGSGQFREASWEEALALVASRLQEIQAQSGEASVLDLASAGCTSALHGTMPLLARFLPRATGFTGSYSIGAGNFALPYLLGRHSALAGTDPATFRHARLILLWGANPLETRHGAEVPSRLLEAKAAGARFVAIDPRRTASARRLDAWWLPCRPGQDAALMLAVLHVLLAEGLVDRPFVEAHAVGFERLEAHVLGRDGSEPKTPRWAESRCGIPAADIERFARDYGTTRPALLLPGFSIQRVQAGEDSFRLALALQLATGNFGRLGGSTGAPISRLPRPKVGTLPARRDPAAPTIPVLHWPDAILDGDRIRAVYTIGGNFLEQGCDVAKSRRAFGKLDFAVGHALTLTATARHCDVVLPAAHALEKEDIGLPWLGNYLLYKSAALPPVGQARSDFEILAELSERMGGDFAEGRSAAQWIQAFLDESEVPDHEAFRRTGLHLGQDQERVGLAAFAADPARFPLGTPSGRVELASARFETETGFPAIPAWRDPGQAPLVLVTPKTAARTHSQGGRTPDRDHALALHPKDAEARGLTDGTLVEVSNGSGRVRVPLRLDEDLAPGVASLIQGVWADLDGEGVDHAGSANLLTDTEGTLPSRSCVMGGIPVRVAAACVPRAALPE